VTTFVTQIFDIMTDPISVLGAVASCVQLLGLLIDSTKTVAQFCNRAHGALYELKKIKYKLEILEKALTRVQEDLGSIDDHAVLPQELWHLVSLAINSVEEDIKELYGICSKSQALKGNRLLFRIKYALIHHDSTMRMLERLERSENTLSCVIELVNLYGNSSHIRNLQELI
jgi:hypothetical protein